jgi:hypothetical protein
MDAAQLPSWFKQRQGKAEPAGDNLLRLTAPNQGEAVIGIRQDNGRWAGFLKPTADGEEIEATPPHYELPSEAWNAAFEIYRRQMIV